MESIYNIAIARFRRPVAPVFLVIILTITGCRISYTFSGASISEEVKTISVQYFQNRASLVQPGLSQYFTDELSDKVRGQTNREMVRDFGDANFEGEIVDYRTVPQTVSGDATAAINRFTITIKVKFTNTVDPEYSFEQTFSRYEDYDSAQDLSSVEQELVEKIVEQLVEDIFNRAFVNW